MRVGTCRNCKAAVVMASHIKTGRQAPIEIQPSDDGNVLVTGDKYEIVPEQDRQAARERGFVLRKNHFATCAFAKQFATRVVARKKSKAATGGRLW